MVDKPERAIIYEREASLEDGGGRTKTVEEYNPAGYATVRGILSPKISLTPLQRGVGNLYGMSVEQLEAGGVSGVNMLQDAVDGGKANIDGPMGSIMDVRNRVRVARAMLNVMPDLTYSPRSAKRMGVHKPIKIRTLVDAICIYGMKMETVAKVHGWGVLGLPSEAHPKPPVIEIPKQQSQKIKAGLVDALDGVLDAWEDMGVELPKWIFDVDVG